MFPPELVDLAQKSPGVILIALALYLFRVVVNDIRHDVEQSRKNTDDLVKQGSKQTDLLERMERHLERRKGEA